MARPLGRWLVAAFVVALALVPMPARAQAAPPPPPAGIGMRLTEAPSDRADDPRALAYIVDHLEPGARIERQIEVSNGTGQRAELSLYPAEAAIDGGGFRAAEGRTANELAGWITVEPDAVVLGPGERAVATVSIAVPPGADDGERYGAVLAEHAPPATDGGVAVVTRVGIRVYLSVGGDEPASDFSITSLTGAGDDRGRHLAAVVTNTGGRALDLTGEATLTDGPGGLSAGPLPTPGATTLRPGDTATVRIPIDPALPEGPWTAGLTLRSGTLERSVTAPVRFVVAQTAPAGQPAPRAPTVVAEVAASSGAAASSAAGPLERLRALAEALVTGLAFPLILLVAIAVFLVLQDRLDRRDTKIGLAPMDADPLLNFE